MNLASVLAFTPLRCLWQFATWCEPVNQDGKNPCERQAGFGRVAAKKTRAVLRLHPARAPLYSEHQTAVGEISDTLRGLADDWSLAP
jgi:hypothetical protein